MYGGILWARMGDMLKGCWLFTHTETTLIKEKEMGGKEKWEIKKS